MARLPNGGVNGQKDQDSPGPRRDWHCAGCRESGKEPPEFRVLTQGVEIGAGMARKGEVSGKNYVSLGLAAPEFGPRKLYANPRRAANQDDNDVFALIRSPADKGLRQPPALKSRGRCLAQARL